MMRMVQTAALAFAICLLSSGCMWGQRYFFYPSKALGRQPDIPFEDVHFESTDNVRLHGWFCPARGQAKATVVFMHGNAQNISHHYPIAAWLPAEGYDVLMFDYRGYGKSTGEPTLRGAVDDCVAAIRYLRARKDVNGERLIVFGQSLGGALAVTAVGKHKPPGVVGVVADSTFPWYTRITREKLRQSSIFPVWLLAYLAIRNSYSPGRFVADISPRPLLVLHGDQDRIVPVHHGRALFDIAAEPKQLVIFPGMRHIQASMTAEYHKVLLEFFARCTKAAEVPDR